jgi:uncharacterized membrane protein YadS
MSDDTEIIEVENWKPKILIAGAVIGALVGIGAAYLYTQAAERERGLQSPDFSAGDGIKLGVMLLGLLRSVADLANKEK